MSFSGAKWENPSDLSCWQTCSSCFRCANKGQYSKCNRCSGRHDPDCKRDPHDVDDKCRCAEGILQYRTRKGKFLLRQFPGNPFEGKVQTEAKTADEADWDRWLGEQREKLDDEHFNPLEGDIL